MDHLIKQFITQNKATIMCAGPMSKNCIDASVNISVKYNIPQILIASRRQIDSAEFGGGYVENFTTSEFVKYVRSKNAPKVFIARDHGGPWQSVSEKDGKFSLEKSMASSKRSFEEDILAGFDFIHIDPSVPILGEALTVDVILKRLFELYGHVDEFAKSNNRKIAFELGTEEQDGYGQNLEQFDYFLNETKKFCELNKVNKPSFVVAQTGTKVMELQNVGIFKNSISMESDLSLSHIINTVEICNKYGVMLKEHNTDYLSNESLSLRPILGIHASNVAPEFGVAETKGLLYLLSTYGFKKEFELFVQTALASKKWVKWLLPDSKTTEIDRAIICGHYIFSDPAIIEMKNNVSAQLTKKGIDMEGFLLTLVTESMMRYVQLFNMIKNNGK